MLIIVGLGNPGEKFKNTRHNVGFMTLDFFAKKNDFPKFTLSKKYNSSISEKDDVILVKPETFMNESGLAVKKIFSSFKFQVSSFIVIQDDIDMPLGKIKFSKDSSSGGHKGVESIIYLLGTKDFARLKIGIATGDEKAKEVVLKKFSPSEKEILNETIKKSAQALDMFTKEGLEKTMNEYNR